MDFSQLIDNGKIHCQVWHAKQPTFMHRCGPLPTDINEQYSLVANYAIPAPDQQMPYSDPFLNVCERIYVETQNTDDRAWHRAMDGMRSTSIGDLIMILHPTTHVGVAIYEVAILSFNKLA
jgi:hypothetical protein